MKLIPFAPGLSGEFHVLKKVVTLLLNCFGEIFPLSDVPLDDPNNKGEAQLRGEIVEDPKPRVDIPREAIIMKQDTHGDETVADFPAEKIALTARGRV